MPDFRSQTPNRDVTRIGLEQQTNQQLTQDAFSLSPDVDAITKAVLDKKLYSADYAPLHQEVSGIIGDYLEKFNKDPFYAFTREGRGTAKTLKQIVDHPSIKAWEENTKMADEEYKRASDNRLNKNLVVNGNEVLALKDGRRQYIHLNDLSSLDASKGDRLLDVDTDMQVLKNVFGVRAGGPKYDMSKLSDVDDKIHKALTGLGYEDTTGVQETGDVDVKHRFKTNKLQLQTALNALVSTGLTESDKNTMRSEYLKSAGDSASTKGFKQWMNDKLQGIASGKLETVREDTPVKSAKLESQALRAGMDKKNPELSAAHLIFTNKTGNRDVATSINGESQYLKGRLMPVQETLNNPNNSSGTYKDDLGNTYTNRTPAALKVFSDAFGKFSVLNRNKDSNGEWISIPGIEKHGAIVDRPGAQPAIVWQRSYIDENGESKPIPVPIVNEILRRQKESQDPSNRNQVKPITPNSPLYKYITTEPLQSAVDKVYNDKSLSDEEKNKQVVALSSSVRSDGYVSYMPKTAWADVSLILPRKKGFFSKIPVEAQQIGDQAEKLGYNSQESLPMQDYYKKYGGSGEITDSPGSPLSIDDEFYEVKAQAPLLSFEQLNSAYGGHTIGDREDVHIDYSGARDNYEMLSPSLFNNSAIPNMVNQKGLTTFSQIQ